MGTNSDGKRLVIHYRYGFRCPFDGGSFLCDECSRTCDTKTSKSSPSAEEFEYEKANVLTVTLYCTCSVLNVNQSASVTLQVDVSNREYLRKFGLNDLCTCSPRPLSCYF